MVECVCIFIKKVMIFWGRAVLSKLWLQVVNTCAHIHFCGCKKAMMFAAFLPLLLASITIHFWVRSFLEWQLSDLRVRALPLTRQHRQITMCKRQRLSLLRPGRGTGIAISLSVREHISATTRPIFTQFFCAGPVSVAWSSSDGVALRYVLPVLWMMSHLAIVGRMVMRGRLKL